MATNGSCNCGGIKFEISASVTDVYVCHCSICRKATASGGIGVCIVSKDKFRWLQGVDLIRNWHKPDHDWQTSFCSICGSSLPGKNDDLSVYIPVGLLDNGHKNLEVKHRLFVDSKGSWETINDNAVHHSTNFSTENT